MDSNLYTVIVDDKAYGIVVDKGDVLAVRPDATAISPDDWSALVAEAGSEAALLELLEVTKDLRYENDNF